MGNEVIGTGTYAPSRCNPIQGLPCPCGNWFAPLAGGDPNGTWSLYVYDDLAVDSGSIAGWTLELTTNAAPAAGDGSYTGPRDSALRDTLAGLASDADDDELDFAAATEPAHGSLFVNSNGTFNYTPEAGFVGVDTFTYRVDDDRLSDEGEVTINVTDVDDRGPEAHPTVSPEPNAAGWHDGDVTVDWNWTDDGAGIDPATCTTQTTSDGQGPLVLTATCTDLAGNETTAEHTVKVDTSAPAVRIDSPLPAEWWLYFPGDSDLVASYTCRDELSGIESCTGTVADGAPLDTSTGYHDLAVTARDRVGHEETAYVTYLVDTPPDANDGSFSGPRDTDLRDTLAGLASDADNDPLVFAVADPPTHGTIALHADGTFRYRPDDGFVGVDTFTYRVHDNLFVDRGEVTITITDIADPGDPRVTISSPTAGRYLQGAVVTADYACTDSASGVAACTGTVADGARIDTSRPGVHSFAVTARDRAGNDHTATVAYTVFVPPTCHGRPATIVGTSGVDVLTGTRGADVIVAGDGRDWIAAGNGNDTICTGAGADTVRGGLGDDEVNSGTARDVVHGGTGNDRLTGHTGGDVLAGGTGNDTLHGTGGNDNLIGGNGNDHISGQRGTDTCRGGIGTDRATACERTLGIP